MHIGVLKKLVPCGVREAKRRAVIKQPEGAIKFKNRATGHLLYRNRWDMGI
jgi:hypothetical protein